jgi:hypothetical protein
VKAKPIILAVALGVVASLMVSTIALADTLSVNFTGNSSYDSRSGVASGSQTSTLDLPGFGSYAGTYSVKTNLLNKCLQGPVVTLDYPGVTPKSSLTLTLDSPLCVDSNVTFRITKGTGLFAKASGAGSVTYGQQGTFNFNGNNNGNWVGGGPALSATPELGSVLLFGSGALGMAGYGLTRLRARRKQPSA